MSMTSVASQRRIHGVDLRKAYLFVLELDQVPVVAEDLVSLVYACIEQLW